MRSSRLLVHVLVWASVIMLYSYGYGQSRTNISGTGGIHTIQGRIYLPNGRTPETSVSVKLSSTNFSTISVDTDHSGSFVFQSVAPGSYALVIEAGQPFETAREYVVIDPEIKIEGMPAAVLPKIFNVPIYLQFKKTVREAAGVINAKLANIPKEALKRYENGLKLSQTGKNEEALAELRQAVVFYPSFYIAYNEIGKICLKLNKLDEAENAFRAALNLNGQEYEARLGFGIVLLNKNEFPEAQKELEEAKTLNQSAAAPHYYLGRLFFYTRKFTDAKNEFELTKGLKNEKDYPLVHYYLGGIYWSEKQYKKAADELEKYLTLDPNAQNADKTRKTIAELRTKESN